MSPFSEPLDGEVVDYWRHPPAAPAPQRYRREVGTENYSRTVRIENDAPPQTGGFHHDAEPLGSFVGRKITIAITSGISAFSLLMGLASACPRWLRSG